MPLLFSLGQHIALWAVQARLEEVQRIFAHLDDVFSHLRHLATRPDLQYTMEEKRRSGAPRHCDPRNAPGTRTLSGIAAAFFPMLERIALFAWLARHFAQAHDAGLWRWMCASWADSLPKVRERHPEVVDMTVDALESDPPTLILPAVVEAARAVLEPPSRGWQHEAASGTDCVLTRGSCPDSQTMSGQCCVPRAAQDLVWHCRPFLPVLLNRFPSLPGVVAAPTSSLPSPNLSHLPKGGRSPKIRSLFHPPATFSFLSSLRLDFPGCRVKPRSRHPC